MPVSAVNGTELYYEVRGSGPPLLLIMGATGEGGVFDGFADLLAADFTVVTYDRRGNGRSAPPADWDATSPEEQADDAAALLDGLGLAPAAVFGTSSGGIFALAALLRHPQAVRAAVLHEPAFFALVDDPAAARTKVTEVITPAMEAGGPTAAFESFLRFAAGDATWERLDASVRERMLASAGTYFGKEIGAFDTYLPDDQAVADIAAPVHLLVGEDSHPEFGQAADQLGARLDTEVTSVPGTHFGYVDHPQEMAKAVSALLRNDPLNTLDIVDHLGVTGKGGAMAPIVSSIEIARRPEEVFAYVSDPSRLAEWQESVVSSRVEGGGPPAVGSRAITTRKIGRREQAMTMEMTNISPPKSWAVRGIDGPVRGVVNGTVELLDDGVRSRVTIELDFEGHGLGKLLVPLVVRRQAQKEMPRNLENLRERLESGA